MESGYFFQAEARNNTEFDNAGRQLLAQLLQHGAPAGAVKLFDGSSKTGADRADFREAPILHEHVEVAVECLQGCSGAFVSPGLKRIVAFNLQESPDLPQRSGDGKPIIHVNRRKKVSI